MDKDMCRNVSYKQVAISSVDSVDTSILYIHAARLDEIKKIVYEWAGCNPKDPLIKCKDDLNNIMEFASKQFQNGIYSNHEVLKLYVEACTQYALISRSLTEIGEYVEEIQINQIAVNEYNLICIENAPDSFDIKGVVNLCDFICSFHGLEDRFEKLNKIREKYSVHYPEFNLEELKTRIQNQNDSKIDIQELFGDLTQYDFKSGFLFFKCYESCKDSDDAFLYLLMACSLFKGQDYYERKKDLAEKKKLETNFKSYSINWNK